jgi:hypothetical protein
MTQFARISISLAAAWAMLVPATGAAQVGDRGLAAALGECRKIADPGGRTACYDAIPLGEPAQPAPAAPPLASRPEQPAGTGFGSNQLPRAPAAGEREPERISAQVSQAVERQPGIYLQTLADGTQWEFVDSAPARYDPPRSGSSVEIIRASMGSYLLRYAGQRSVRARRVR